VSTLRISIVTPSLNQGEFIEDTIQSVIGQAYPNLEYVVVDGGSTDQTLKVLEKYRKHITHLIVEPDEGQTDALIKGFSLATGEIMGWLNSDDLLEANALSEVAEFFSCRTDTDFVYGDAIWLERNGRFLKSKKEIGFRRFIWLYDHNYIPQPSAFWRRTLYDKVGGLDSSFNLAMDADLFDRFSSETQMTHVRKYWSRMRWYPEQKNQALRTDSEREMASIRNRNGCAIKGLRNSVNHAAARIARIGLKALTGCYY
jgi:glycosyltransferase involved in cell wall biosynthesis